MVLKRELCCLIVSCQGSVQRLPSDRLERARRASAGAADHLRAGDQTDPLLLGVPPQHQRLQQRERFPSCHPRHTTAQRRQQ